jgi:hypothetical protein
MKPRRLSQPLRFLLTALLALAVAALFSRATQKGFWPWLADVILGMVLASWVWENYLEREEFRADQEESRRAVWREEQTP